MTRGQIIMQAFIMTCLLSGGVFLGYVYGYHEGTGTMPFSSETQAVLPPEVTDVTPDEVAAFVKEDLTNEIYEYEEGFNCVEYAVILAREAHWKGLPAEPMRVIYEGTGVQHLLLAFSTNDGWVIIDPATDLEVKPRIGGELAGKRIIGLDILRFEWIPFEVTE